VDYGKDEIALAYELAANAGAFGGRKKRSAYRFYRDPIGSLRRTAEDS
jgi:hypothetical protein